MSIRSNLPRSGIRELMDASSRMPDAIHLEVGEPNVDTPMYICEAAMEAMKKGFTHYTPNAGLYSLREKLAAYLNDLYLLHIVPEQTIVTSGAVNALSTCLLTLVDTGEEVLIPDPGWPNYEQMVLNQNAIPVRYLLKPENHFIPDLDDLEKAVSNKTKVIIINSPGNPTGSVYPEDKLKDILSFASKHNLYVISDEVYDGIVYDGKHNSALSFDQEDRVISVYSFSKNYAMTGWRVGYAVAPLPVAKVMAKVQEPIISCPSSISQKAAEAAIAGPRDFIYEMCEIYKKRRDQVYSIFNREGIKAYNPEGAFYMLIDLSEVSIPSHEIAHTLLHEEHVAVAPGSTFGKLTEKMIRISFAVCDEDLVEGARRICNFIKRHSI